MLRPSAQKIIHEESFDKVCELLNMVHHVRHTYWDLRVQAILWAYRTMCKTLTMWALPKLKYEAEDVIPMEHAKPRSCTVATVDMMFCEAQKGGITQPQEIERMGLEEAIQQGNLRLREIEKERIRLREKSALMDAEFKKLEDKIKEEFFAEKTRMVRQGPYNHSNKFEHYRREFINLMPQLGPHIAKHSDQGSALQMVKCAMTTETIKGGDSLGTMTEDQMELYMGGVAT